MAPYDGLIRPSLFPDWPDTGRILPLKVPQGTPSGLSSGTRIVILHTMPSCPSLRTRCSWFFPLGEAAAAAAKGDSHYTLDRHRHYRVACVSSRSIQRLIEAAPKLAVDSKSLSIGGPNTAGPHHLAMQLVSISTSGNHIRCSSSLFMSCIMGRGSEGGRLARYVKSLHCTHSDVIFDA